MKKNWWLWYGISVLVIVIDQITKVWAESALAGGHAIVVIPSWFRFELAYNTGAAFSFLGSAGGWQRWFFSVVALGVSVFIAVWISRLARHNERGHWLELTGLCLILGGAIGNLYDRVLLGHVIDFIVWHYHQYHWPTFNMADSAICIGAGLLIADMLFLQRKKPGQTAGE